MMVLEYLDEVLGVMVGLVTASFGFLGVLIGVLYRRVAGLEADRDKLTVNITEMKSSHEAEKLELWARLEESAITKRKQADFIDVLEHHIWGEKGPPPPTRPDDI